jgi:membrane associated rhomboid family serine protease
MSRRTLRMKLWQHPVQGENMLVPLRVDVWMWRRPIANYVILAVTVAISLVGFANPRFYDKMVGKGDDSISLDADFDYTDFELIRSFTPRLDPDAWRPVAAITSSFLHGGVMHLLGNMWFLWVFGNAVNYKFGHWQYAALYLTCALAGGMSHYLATDNIPVVGASGAIYGVMGAYVVFFPRNDVVMMFWAYIIRRDFSISSWVMIALWVGWDLLQVLNTGTSGPVALAAHLGGFVLGFSVGMLCAATELIKPTEDEQTTLHVFNRRGEV